MIPGLLRRMRGGAQPTRRAGRPPQGEVVTLQAVVRTLENKMRTHRFSLAALAATTILVAGALAAPPLFAQQQAPAPQQAQQLPPPKPYKPVAVKLPQPV